MHGGHDLLPDLSRGVAVEGHTLGRVVAGPHGTGVIRRVAAEPAVAVCTRRTGLTGDGHIVKARLGAGAVGGCVIEHIGHGAGGALRECLKGSRLIVENYLAAAVLDHGIASGIGENTVVCKRGVCLSHLTHGYAVVRLAQRHCRVVRVRVDKTRHAQTRAHEFERRRGGELIHYLRGDGVLGLLKRGSYRDDAVVGVRGVLRIPRGVRKLDVILALVENQCRGGDEPVFDRGTVDRDGLNGRSGGSRGVGGSVQTVAYGLDPRAAGEGFDLARVLVNDDDGALKLRLRAVAGFGQLLEVRVHGIDLCLNVGVDAGVYLVACVMNELACRLAADALCLGKVGDDVGEDDLLVIGVRARAVRLVFTAHEVKLLADRLLVLLLCLYIALLIHFAQDVLLTLLVVFNAVKRVVIRRQVCNSDDGRGLGNAQIFCVLAEIGLRRGLDAVAALAEVNGVEIILKDLFLVVVFLKVERLEYLKQLALHRYIVLLSEVFYELLGYRRAAEGRAAGEHIQCRVCGAEPVNAFVRVKTLVLDGNERVLHILRYLIAVYPDAVFAALHRRQLLRISV